MHRKKDSPDPDALSFPALPNRLRAQRPFQLQSSLPATLPLTIGTHHAHHCTSHSLQLQSVAQNNKKAAMNYT
jgi:hypothetical protein